MSANHRPVVSSYWGAWPTTVTNGTGVPTSGTLVATVGWPPKLAARRLRSDALDRIRSCPISETNG